jgi:excisionase family DNA binding protein
MNDRMITVAEAAKILGCSRAKIYKLHHAGKLELKTNGLRTVVSERAVRSLIGSPLRKVWHHFIDHRRLRVPEAAKYIGITTDALYDIRAKGIGPPFIKIGGIILYDTRVIDDWLAANSYKSIAEYQLKRARAFKKRKAIQQGKKG